jgi:hypothetical protein
MSPRSRKLCDGVCERALREFSTLTSGMTGNPGAVDDRACLTAQASAALDGTDPSTPTTILHRSAAG